VDAALRQRITRFYQDHVDGKFRQAERYVAEDTKDFYYEANKPTYLAFRIDQILYSENFTRAKAIVICNTRFNMPGFEGKSIDAPVPSTWKLESGEWFWYVDQSSGRETPFGRMRPLKEGTPAPGGLPSMANAPTVESLWKAVKADKNVATLNAKQASTDEVTISSTLPGVVKLRLDVATLAGLKVELDRSELKSGEKAKVVFRFEPGAKAIAGTVEGRVYVDPIGLVIPLTATIQ
jgi:hypothetical protein